MSAASKNSPPDAVMESIRDWTGVLSEGGADPETARSYVLDALSIAVRWRAMTEPALIPARDPEKAAEYRCLVFEHQAEMVVKLLLYPGLDLEPRHHALIVAQAKIILRWLAERRL